MIEKDEELIKVNLGVIVHYKGNSYKKVKESIACDGCATNLGTNLCFAAGDCSGIILHKFRSFIDTFKQL